MAWRIAIVALALVAPARAGQLQVLQHIWGFNGRVAPGRMNPLSLEVANLSPEPFDGVLKLVRGSSVAQRRGATLAEPCFISPGARRWVQFYPCTRQEQEAWVVEWGFRVGDRETLRNPKFGPPGRVVLLDPAVVLTRKARFPVLPDNLFPPTVTATDGLYSVVLDHMPRWEPVRQRAFIDWLRRGGEVHLVHDANDRYPTFTGALAVLNAPLERFPVGAGTVVRHPLPHRKLDGEALAEKGFPLPTYEANYDAPVHDLDGELFESLRDLTRPKHNWLLIYLTSVVYIVLIWPVNYVCFVVKRRDYRLTVLFFVLCVAGCSALLMAIGRRGHEEATAVHAVACARQIDADHYDTTQWVNAFVTRGAVYPITHDSPHNLYAACQDYEAVPGLIHSGKGGVFQADIPLYSARHFLHRGRLVGHRIALEVEEWGGGSRLSDLAITFEDGFPTDAHAVWALCGGRFYRLQVGEGRLRLGSGSGHDAKELFTKDALRVPKPHYFGPFRTSGEEEPPDKRLQRLMVPLMARAVAHAGTFWQDVRYPALPPDRMQIFIYAPLPEGFRLQEPRFGEPMGYVLYQIELRKPEKTHG